MINNAYKLSAVLTTWINPVVQQFAAGRMSTLPFVQLIENRVKASGWVSPAWSLASEISPLLNNVSSALVQPMLQRYISQVPDANLPKMAHSIVEEAIKQGYLSFDKDNDKHIYYLDPETYGNINGNKEIVINLYEAKVE